MATKKQIAANRRNAKKSTGPRTSAGKAVSRQNALRHGLHARTLSLPSESWQELIEIRDRFLRAWQPQTPDQRRLVARVAFAEWKLLQWRDSQTQLGEAASKSGLCPQLRGGPSARQARLERDLRDAYDKLTHSMGPDSPESHPLLNIA